MLEFFVTAFVLGFVGIVVLGHVLLLQALFGHDEHAKAASASDKPVWDGAV